MVIRNNNHSSPVTVPAGTEVTPEREDVGVRVAAQAQAFAATLADRQRAQLLRAYSKTDARNWSNYPQAVLGARGRVGLETGSLTGEQWNALHALLSSATGSGAGQGYDEICQHLAADDHLRALGGRHGYGRGNFRIAFLGTPAVSGWWQLQFGGHHLAVSHTYRDGRLVGVTPSFRGIEPFGGFTQDGVRLDPGRGKHAALVGLLSGLSERQARAARLPGPQPDILLGPGQDDRFPSRPRGIAGGTLDPHQRELLRAALAAYVDDTDDVSAERILAGYTRELDATHLAFAGSASLDSVGDYVRIDGPAVWIEYSLHDGIVRAGPHPHSVWRDRRSDYGGDQLLDGMTR